MVRTRQLLAVTLVATALAADRAVAVAAPVQLQQQASMRTFAGRMVSRLTSKLRRVVPVIRMSEVRPGERIVTASNFPHAIDSALHARVPLNPFQFRLPPPAV